MTSDVMLRVLEFSRECIRDNGWDNENEEYDLLLKAIAWLEEMPKGTALAGVDCEYWKVYGIRFTKDTTVEVCFISQP